MSDSPPVAGNRAVFLSYAREDTPAAQRIADALRAAGIEVWFDQSELRGGDAWDAKIRQQIKECALFVPVISANTQSRQEGYFRVEWRLADRRTEAMGKSRPFLVPVCIDATRDGDADVPDSFLAVQWTRLANGEANHAFCERVRNLLSPSTETGRTRFIQRDESAAQPVAAPSTLSPTKKTNPPWLTAFIIGVPLVVGLALAWRVLPHPSSEPAAPARPPAAAASAAPMSEARKLALRADAMFDQIEDATRGDLDLAEQLCKQAIALDPNDAEIRSIYARLLVSYLTIYDPSPERRAAARVQAEQAAKLAPDSDEAQLALANFYRLQNPTHVEAERLLRALVARRPDFKRAWRILGHTSKSAGQYQEAIASYERAVALPGGDLLSLQNRAMCLGYLGRDQEAEAALDELLRIHPSTISCVTKAMYATYRADFAAAKTALDQVPAAARLEAFYVVVAAQLALWLREPAPALEVLSAMSGKIVEGFSITSPKLYWVGLALKMTNRPDAATLAWHEAVQAVDEQLATHPSSFTWLAWKAVLLAKLGEVTEARRLSALAMQMEGADANRLVKYRLLATRLRLGEREPAVDELRKLLRSDSFSIRGFVQYDSEFDGLRDEPWFRTLVAEATTPPSTPTAPAPEQKSVAVLAFANLSDDKSNEYFSDGISEELLTVLQKIPELHVAARTSAFSFKGKNATAQEIGATLNVAHLVEGSVQRIGNRVKIAARLSRAATGEQLWSENFTRDLADVFAVQSEIAQTIVVQLRGRLTGETAAAAKAEIQAQVKSGEKGGTKNAEAHEFYLRGKFFANQTSVENMRRAEALFQQAVDLDPQFAQAWAAWSSAASYRAGVAETRAEADDALSTARRAADRALAVEPNLAATQLARYDVQVADFDWKGAVESLRLAAKLAPDDAEVLSRATRTAYFCGQREKAIELGRQAVALDPVNALRRWDLGLAFVSARRFAEAEVEFRRQGELVPGTGHNALSMSFNIQGRFDEAAAEARLNPYDSGRYNLVMAQWGQKKTAEADATLARFIQTSADVSAYQLAEVYAFRRENDRAFEWMERAYRQRDPGLAQLKLDLLLENLHSEPRWPAFLKKIGLSDEQLK